MSIELCPKCRLVRNMKVTKTKSTKKDSRGNVIVVKIFSYHCQECNTFVRSEEIREPSH